jgi:hypothetical protein
VDRQTIQVSRIRETIRQARGRKVTVDAAAMLEVVDAAQQLHDYLNGVICIADSRPIHRQMERFEIAVVTLSGSVEPYGRP